ncbi:MAG: hypothetical protein R8G34_06785 [Paracoccaceae bacterium]|nr:hypothetical protein [Paracoccaceae bacterium]
MQRLTYQNARAVALLAGLSALAACGEQGSTGAFYREAGSQIDSGAFGAATRQNIAAQTCRTSGFGAGKAGVAPADPIVALDPVSTRANPVYRVYCDGRLDGKYAQIIYSEYVESATQKTETEDVETE